MIMPMTDLVDELEQKKYCLYPRYGKKMGKRWAMEMADPNELELLAQWYQRHKRRLDDILDPDSESDLRQLIHDVIRPDEKGGYIVTRFWESVLGDFYNIFLTDEPGFLPSFVKAAVDVWKKAPQET
jgi:hypothetical protein